MKKLKYGVAFKAAAAIVSYFTVLCTVLCILTAFFLFDNSFYTRSLQTVQVNVLSDMLRDEAYRIGNNYIHFYDQTVTEDFYDRFEDSNLYYTISIRSNLNPEPVLIADNSSADDTLCTVSIDYSTEWTEWLSADEYNGLSDKNSKYYILDSYDGNYYRDYDFVANITLSVKQSMPSTDKYSFALKWINTGYSMRYSVFLIGVLSAVSAVALWIYLFCAAGRCSEDGSIRMNLFDRIPFDLLLVLAAFLVFCCGVLLVETARYSELFLAMIIILIVSVAAYFTVLAVLLSFAARVKAHALLRGTLCYKLLHAVYRFISPIKRRLGYLAANLNLVVKSALICVFCALAELLILLIFTSYETDMLVLFWLIGNLLAIPAILLISVSMVKLKKGGEEIAGGNLQYKIDTANMFGDFKRFGESLNHINVGMQTAVNEQMKSERMKTELITNVSHDIKTPLTSIINYVDLIKKQEPENPTMREYIDVLDRQSNRLKKLIEDLVEASKASSGALKVTFAPSDAGVLLSQAEGEYEERFTAAGLIPVLNIPQQEVCILADGRHLWRVFDNLMNNICKYTQPGTRVYIDLAAEDGKAVISFKNISRCALNISGDELMERFVRGDSSRSTEGSGLGLSIARSLTELQNGTMRLSVDGDLFKVVLTFPLYLGKK